jgi:hypothetical protein
LLLIGRDTIEFLQNSEYSDKDGSLIGYMIHYNNGEIRTAPIIKKTIVFDWGWKQGDSSPSDAVEAWVKHNSSSRN